MRESFKYKILKVAKMVVPDRVFHKSANYYLHLRKGILPKNLNLKKPKNFNEKIIFNKLNNRFENGHLLADKYEVRHFIRETIGEEYLIPLIGLFDNVDSIPFPELPSQFVIKITQGSGWNIIVKDKNTADISEIKKRLNFWLNLDYSIYGREWQYNKKTSKIIVENYLVGTLYDYKYFCFNGIPKFIQVDLDRQYKHTRHFYDLDWNKQPFSLMYPNSNEIISPPENLSEMNRAASKLSQALKEEMDFARIDFYNQNGRIQFGEITFHPGGGCEPFFPSNYDRKIGEYWL